MYLFMQAVLVAVLDVVNTIIALSRDTNVEYLMEKGLIPLVQPLCLSSAPRVRLLAVWILGNAGTVYFKELVIRPAVVATLVEVIIGLRIFVLVDCF